jgi:hypothetical protein
LRLRVGANPSIVRENCMEMRTMITLAKTAYWLTSVLAALLLAATAFLLLDIAYGQEMPDWWLHALSLALLAGCVWFVGWVFRYFVWRIWDRPRRQVERRRNHLGVEAASIGGVPIRFWVAGLSCNGTQPTG